MHEERETVLNIKQLLKKENVLYTGENELGINTFLKNQNTGKFDLES